MPTQKFSFRKGEPTRLEVSWGSGWKDVVILVDSNEVGRIINKNELKEGKEFYLQDGSILKIKLIQVGVAQYSHEELELLRNGKPLPGSSSDPETRLSSSYNTIYWIGGYFLVLGLGAVLGVPYLRERASVYDALFGAIMLFLGSQVKEQSVISLALAFILNLIWEVMIFINMINLQSEAGQHPQAFQYYWWFGWNIMLVVFILQGFKAIRDLKRTR